MEQLQALGKTCFLCGKNLNIVQGKAMYGYYLMRRIPIPAGMTKDDVTCMECYDKYKDENKENVKEAQANLSKETTELFKRTPEYKKNWNKYGIIQFKNDRIAILKRSFGAQVEFIIAFDDITGEGYELKAIDEGKQANGQVLSGGLDSYYYFQKLRTL
jgi:hypothetical protein